MVNAYISQNCKEVSPNFYHDYGVDPSAKTKKKIVTLKDIESYVENSISNDEKGANGVVFTPRYIIEYILKNISISEKSTVLDPSCGCGSFLVEAVCYISEKTGKTHREVIESNIFGLDIVPKFIETAKLILALLCLSYGEDIKDIKYNLYCVNSLDSDWKQLFNVNGFDAIIGNPPYSNPHDLDEKMAIFIKEKFKTTKKGTSNIYYAFIEKSMANLSKAGHLGFIIPNNYLTIVAAQPLRKMLKESHMLEKIVDFNDNMVFAPVRSYNSLLFLKNEQRAELTYAVMEKCEDIKEKLNALTFNTLRISELEDAGWKLLSKDVAENIRRIESFPRSIKKYIHTGIATLRDDLYIVDRFNPKTGCYIKTMNGIEYEIEAAIVRDLYKISNIKTEESLESAVKHIICPYDTIRQTKLDGTFNRISKLMSEEKMMTQYPKCYHYFCEIREELDARDAGRGAGPIWYAYGRTQSLNYIGRKLVFPTFSSKPKFMMLNDEEALFCNGYVIVEDKDIPLELLQKIINSEVMEYYVSSTSYPIEGGYYCYQKKFIQNFTIPTFTDEEIEQILNSNQSIANKIIYSKYQLPLNK